MNRIPRVIDMLWLFALMAYVVLGVPSVPLHGDEATHIYMSRDYAYQFIERDLSKIAFLEDPLQSDDPEFATQQELRLLNGTLFKYAVGFVWHLNGYTVDDLNQQWVWGADLAYNRDNGHMPDDNLLIWSRTISAVFTALSVAALWGIAETISGRGLAYVSTLIYTLTPMLLLNGRRSMIEGGMMLFTMLAILATLHFLKHRQDGQRWLWLLLLGLATGFAVAAKHTSVLTLAPLFGGAGLVLIYDALKNKRFPLATFAGLVGAGLLGLIVFYAMNPAWWHEPLARVVTVLETRDMILSGQVDFFGGYADWGERLNGFTQYLLVGTPQYFESPDWALYIADQIAAYEASFWRGLSLGETLPGLVILGFLMIFGLWQVLIQQSARNALTFTIGLLIFTVTALTVLVTPIGWQRYYLLCLPGVALLAGGGVLWMVENLLRFYNAEPASEHQDISA